MIISGKGRRGMPAWKSTSRTSTILKICILSNKKKNITQTCKILKKDTEWQLYEYLLR